MTRDVGGISGVRGGNNYNVIWEEGTIYGGDDLAHDAARCAFAVRTVLVLTRLGGGKLRLRNMTLEMVPANIRVVILKLRLGKRIEVGFDTRIGPRCSLKVMKGGKLRLRGTYLTRDIQLEVARNALLEIGKSMIGPGVIISAQELVSIGDGSGVAEYSSIRDQNHVHTPEYPLADWRFSTAPVRIGCDVWIASKVTVVAGITIADHAMCAAGAVVTKDVGPWEKVGGVPARPLRQSRPTDTRRADESLACSSSGQGRKATRPLG